MKRENEKGSESSRLLLPFTHVFVRTPVVPYTVPFRTLGTVPNAVRKISPRSSGRTERSTEIESILLRRLQDYSCVVLFERVTPLSFKHAKKEVISVA